MKKVVVKVVGKVQYSDIEKVVEKVDYLVCLTAHEMVYSLVGYLVERKVSRQGYKEVYSLAD
jgi:hypothetical protein